MSVALTREQMNRIRTLRNKPLLEAVRNDGPQWCAVAAAEVHMPENGVCLWCWTDHTHRSKITNRQVESMRLLAHGGTRKQIAHQLNISETTVANDWRDVRKSLGARTTTQAVVMLVREGSV